MIIKDFENPLVIEESISPTPPKHRIKFIFGMVDEVPYVCYGEGKNVNQARKMAEQGWEYYKSTHYGPTTHVETVRNGQEMQYADKYKGQE